MYPILFFNKLTLSPSKLFQAMGLCSFCDDIQWLITHLNCTLRAINICEYMCVKFILFYAPVPNTIPFFLKKKTNFVYFFSFINACRYIFRSVETSVFVRTKRSFFSSLDSCLLQRFIMHIAQCKF